MRNGAAVERFERAFAEYVGARYAIALCNGTATLHTALAALGVVPGEPVAVPPLTMSATTLAVLHAGAVPVFVDVDARTWLMQGFPPDVRAALGVSLYGLPWKGTWYDYRDAKRKRGERGLVDDAAQTLSPLSYGANDGYPDFKSYSFQSSKILSLGEGGMLATNNETLATAARRFSSLGYRMAADQPRINTRAIRHPLYERHHAVGWNYRMNDATAFDGIAQLRQADALLRARRVAAQFYAGAVAGCRWITPQYVPDGWTHDYWCYAVALESAALWEPFVAAIERHGGERPYAAWRLAYQEPALRHLAPDGTCPVAESLQPRLVQFQTNNVHAAKRNADAVAQAIRELS
jgi:perosamine synthetase